MQIAEGNCRDRFGVTRKAYNWAIASAADPAPKWLWDSDTGEILDGIVAASGSSWDLADAKRLAVAATKEKS